VSVPLQSNSFMIIDLDANATYVPSKSLQELVAAWQQLGNPSSIHRGGQRAKAAVEQARELVRKLVGAGPKDSIVFTSGASEANNTVVCSAVRRGGHLVSSNIEHPCVLAPLTTAVKSGSDLSFVNANPSGEVLPAAVIDSVRADTTFVSIMTANNETGVVNDLESITRQVRSVAPRAFVHTDAAQVVGKLPFSFNQLGVDCMTLSGHKFGALSGTGAMIIRDGATVEPLILGGPQEGKMRGGTENVLGIISLGLAASDILSEGVKRESAMRAARDTFEQALLARLANCEVNGTAVRRLPNTSSVFIEGVRADDLVVALDLEGIYVSSGAACSSGKPEPSHVLTAMGQTEQRVRSTIRVSFRADQHPEMGLRVAGRIAEVVTRMRGRR